MFGMNPGELREQITLQEVTEVSDGMGGKSSSWVDRSEEDYTVWAKITPSMTPERLVGMRADGPVSHVVTVRYDAPVTRKQRVRWGSRYLKIVSQPVNLDTRQEFKTFLCLEEAVDG